MAISIDEGTQKPLLSLLKMIILMDFLGTPIHGNTHMVYPLVNQYASVED